MDEDKKMRGLDKRIDDYRSKIKDSNDLKLESGVFDVPTLKTLYTMASKNIIKAFGGVVSTGKEADVFHAIGENERELAVKIYRISTSDFRSMENYLIGDPRFSNIGSSKKDIVFAWTKKEHRNLERAREAGVKAPEPYTSERNILVMEFIGKDGVSAPRLKDIKPAEPQRTYDTIAQYMRLLYQTAKLVHGDLSEYNILLYEDEPVIIDMGQAVMLEHPMSREFLARDIKNVVRYFKKLGVDCQRRKPQRTHHEKGLIIMQEHIKVPQDRIGAIIGVEGNVKKIIEEKTGVSLNVDSESGVVIVESEGDAMKALKAAEVIKAIARGFSPEKALRLLDSEDLILDVIDLSKFSDSPSDLKRVKGRIIGKNGKTREVIEQMSGARVSVYGKTISMIGDAEQLTTTRAAIDMLLDGAPHGAVYNYLEKRRRELKMISARIDLLGE